MDLSFNDEQQLIAESAVALLGTSSSLAQVRKVSERGDGLDAGLWKEVGSLGWCGVHLPESAQGLGLGLVELALLQEQLGRHLACVPFFDSVALAATLLREIQPCKASQSLLGAINDNSQIVALAMQQSDLDAQLAAGALGMATAVPIAVANETGWRLEGNWPLVGSAHWAQALLLPAQSLAGEPLLFLVPRCADGLQVQPVITVDATRRSADVSAQALALPKAACLCRGAELKEAWQRAACLAAIALAAENVGVAQAALDLTLTYTRDRQQFGKPIAGFQAVKHRCANMLVALERARSAVYGAAAIADTKPDPATLLHYTAQSRLEADHAALFCSREAIQLHGGMGFTWEFDPHRLMRRAQVNSQRLGHADRWCELVAQQLLDTTSVQQPATSKAADGVPT